MIIGIGTDIVDVHRIQAALEKYGERLAHRIFTETERNYCEERQPSRLQHYAARFAVKEAFSKAIGTGMRDGFAFNLVGVINEPSGKPLLQLSGLMLERWGHCRAYVSISHTAAMAMAVVVLETDGDQAGGIQIMQKIQAEYPGRTE
jgi:holo-[acyl-carrier protein] synthase